MSTKINHVSVNARDLQASVDFYVDLLGARRSAARYIDCPAGQIPVNGQCVDAGDPPPQGPTVKFELAQQNTDRAGTHGCFEYDSGAKVRGTLDGGTYHGVNSHGLNVDLDQDDLDGNRVANPVVQPKPLLVQPII